MGWAQLGPLGFMQDIPSPRPNVMVEAARPGSAFVTLDGVQHVQVGARAPRSWLLAFPLLTPVQVGFLSACAQGAVPGPLYLHTEDAARSNMLAPHIAAPGIGGDVSLGPVSATRVIVGGVPMLGTSAGAAPGAWSRTVPVRAGTLLGLSAHVTAASSLTSGTTVAEWRTVNVSGGQVSTGTVPTLAAGTQARAASTFTPSPTAVGVQLRVSPTVGGVARTIAALRLTEGAHDEAWVPGAGGAQVVVSDPAQTLLAIDVVQSDYTVTLREVG